MKNLLINLLYFSILASCAQSNTKKIPQSLTKNNYVETLLAEIKHYPKEPLYYMYISNSLCVYEILVNDVPIKKLFKYQQLANPIYINSYILKSGRQKISFKIYPAPPEFNGSGDVFSPNTSFGIKVQVQDYKDPKAGDNDSIVAKYNLPTKIRLAGTNNNLEIQEFEAEGQKYYEGSFYFDATVPYENEGWSNGQDLRKLDQKLLMKYTTAFYKAHWDIYNTRRSDLLLNDLFLKEKETAQATYDNKETLLRTKKDYFDIFKNESLKMEPLVNYKLVLYGDGKLVTLEQADTTDTRIRGKSALWGKSKDIDDNTIANFRNYYLYLPQGKSLEDGLEVIR